MMLTSSSGAERHGRAWHGISLQTTSRITQEDLSSGSCLIVRVVDLLQVWARPSGVALWQSVLRIQLYSDPVLGRGPRCKHKESAVAKDFQSNMVWRALALRSVSIMNPGFSRHSCSVLRMISSLVWSRSNGRP